MPGRFKCETKLKWALPILFLSLADTVMAKSICIEAESLNVKSGWEVIKGRQGFCVGQPMLWSANRLRASSDDQPAVAETTLNVPEAGSYNLWVRYESPYGFDTLFSVEIGQGKSMQQAVFGGKDQSKYFPFKRGWQVQGPWFWHSSDYVYQKMTVNLEKGNSVLCLRKARNGQPSAARSVDLFYLTDDLKLEPGSDWGWRGKTEPAILSQFRAPVYFRVKAAPGAEKPPLVKIYYRMWLIGYWQGPTENYWLTQAAVYRETPKVAQEAASDSKWLELVFSTAQPALLTVSCDQPAQLQVSANPQGKDAVSFEIGADPVEIIARTGNSFYEDPLLRGVSAVRLSDYLAWLTGELEKEPIFGKRAKRFALLSGFPVKTDGFDVRNLAAACGLTGQHGRNDKEVYGTEGDRFGFIRTQGYYTIQNIHLNQPCFEGNYEGLEKNLRKTFENLRAKNLETIPQNLKLIEESGPPALDKLRAWPKINEMFRVYLKERGVRPSDVLSREELIRLVSRGTVPTENELWKSVILGLGTPEEAVVNPVLFYHSHDFRALLFARNSAAATRLVERIFPKGTNTNSGSFYPSTGGQSVLQNGVEPFLLFREGGATSYSSEISWGLNTPEYVGTQTESYNTALGRALTKYRGGPIGNFLIMDGNRGYTPEFVELASYAMAAQGASWMCFYELGYPAECNVFGYPDILKAVRRACHALGAVEDTLLDAPVVPARIAVGWSRSTDIWDMAEPQKAPLGPGNTIYSQERNNLYLLLRHLQMPVDLLGEDDISEGYLKDYRIFFLVGDHLSERTATALKDWVTEGGFLVSVAGGGLRDVYNRPLPVLEPVFGIKNANLIKGAEALRPKLELLHTEPLDSVNFSLDGSSSSMPALGYKQTFETNGASVIGSYRDGKPAATINSFGKGKALLLGALPGTAYMKDAFPLRPFGRGGEDLMAELYPSYNVEIRDLMRKLIASFPDAANAAIAPVVSREPLVEVNIRRNAKTAEYCIALVNFSGKPIPELSLLVDSTALNGAKVIKAAFGKVKQSAGMDGKINVTVPINRFEVLTCESR